VKMLGVILILLGSLTAGCGNAGGAPSEESNAQTPVGPESITITEKTGDMFSCFVRPRESGPGEILYCYGLNPVLSINSAVPFAYVETDSSFSAFEVWDDTVCVVTSVAQTPLARSAGSALYCFGEASLGFNYVSYDLVYSGPVFSTAAHGSAGLTYHTEPFTAGEESMDLMLNIGGTWLVMSDGRGQVSTNTQSCSRDSGTLTCNNFTLTLE